jgi:hypothetical protein
MQLSTSEQSIIQDSIKLNPQSRYLVVEKIIESLNMPNESLDELWIKESSKRLDSYQKGKLKTVSYSQVFDK